MWRANAFMPVAARMLYLPAIAGTVRSGESGCNLGATKTRPLLRSRSKPRVRVGAIDPRAAILDAAERLCGERGIEAVSLREIAKAAGVNLSALNYYFGSRTNLLVTILQTRCKEQDQERHSC